MKIASLLPAATEWLARFGAIDQLIARSHECNYPPEVQEVPVITSSSIEGEGSSSDIDSSVQEHLEAGLSLYGIAMERLAELCPDLIITQTQCDVCAVSEQQLSDALAAVTTSASEIFSFAPSTFKQVLDEALRLGRASGHEKGAMDLIAEKEHGLRRLRDAVAGQSLPTVLGIEWMDPLMVAGHWTPDLIEHAGGTPLLSESGAPSRYIEWEEVVAADPDVICLLPCGFTLSEVREHLSELTDHEAWANLRAVRQGRVYAFNGDSYFNRPGPRLYRSIELMAFALHGTAYVQEAPRPGPHEMARLRSRCDNTEMV